MGSALPLPVLLSFTPMNISLRWLLRYLSPPALAADEVEHALTFAGFPLESRTPLPDADTRLDVEITSNRGDCLSHLGLARELAAATGRALLPPACTPPGPSGEPGISLTNDAPDACPRFTARLIRGVRVAPSPPWLVAALEAVGQRSINNLVDLTNFITFELGNPCHVFDADRLAGRALVVRRARPGETLTTLDAKPRALHADDVVVADARAPQSLAGVIGGLDSAVSSETRDVVLEVATWDPATVRATARRHAIRTDASHRFERLVDPRTIDLAADRAASLIVELAGGSPAPMLDRGSPIPPPAVVPLRPSRATLVLGSPVPDAEILRIFHALQIDASPAAPDLILTRIPSFRPDLEREIDLIEEIARIRGLDKIPILDRLPIRARPPQGAEVAMRELASLLASRGFYETVTFSFLSPTHAEPFLPARHSAIQVDDSRREGEPILRPSTIPSLILCRRANHHAAAISSLRLFECASVFSQPPTPGPTERRTLALLIDVPGPTLDDRQHALRALRGEVESLVRALAGPDAALAFTPAAPPVTAFDPDAHAVVTLGDIPLGSLALLAPETLRRFDLDLPVAACELDLEPLLSREPPAARVRPIPQFPAIERDLSLILPEPTRWESVRALVRRADLDLLESIAFVSTFRGKSVTQGSKSVTLRLRFRHPERTLRKDEVEPHVARLVALARAELAADLRA